MWGKGGGGINHPPRVLFFLLIIFFLLVLLFSRGMIYTRYEFNIYTFISFDWIYELFYDKGMKIICNNIRNYIISLSLVVWIIVNRRKTRYSIRVSVNAFYLWIDCLICLNIK